MATINEPTIPTYGPDTFTDLASALATLWENDQALNTGSGGGGGSFTLPDRLGESGETLSDLNLGLDSGWYNTTSSSANRPTSDSAVYVVLTLAKGSNSRAQIAIAVNQSVAGNMYVRSMNGGTWGSWNQVGGYTPPTRTVVNISYESGYSRNTSYEHTKLVVNDGIAHLMPGVTTCPASFSGGVYYTIGSFASDAPSGQVMGVGAVYTVNGTSMETVQVRVTTSGQLQFLSPVAIPEASYILIPSLSWRTS